MKDLEPPDSFFLQAARVCLERGERLAAEKELAAIQEGLRSHPDVLEIRWTIQMHARKWQASLDLAQAIVNCAPGRPTGWIRRSFVLHRLKRTQEALDKLFPAAEKFSEIAMIPYNLACYSAQLQYLWEAERWLKRAVEIGGTQIKALALQDKDLQPLWAKSGAAR